MMKNIILAMCCMVMLAGCQQTDEIANEGERLPMYIKARIGKSELVSRYFVETPNSVSFYDGDEIGLSVNDGAFVQWTYSDGRWNVTPAVNWNDKSSEHTFTAFYPFVAGAVKNRVPMPNLVGQDGTMKSVATRDFLVSTKKQTYGANGIVSFTDDDAFKHVSSLVSITLKGAGELVGATITGISISGEHILTPSSYSFEVTDGKVTLSNDAATKADLLEVSPSYTMTSEGMTYYFVLNSGTVELADVTLSIQYEKNSKTYNASIEGLGTSAVNSFESGKQYSYALKVAGGVLVVTGNEIAPWGNGLTMDDIVINGSEVTES